MKPQEGGESCIARMFMTCIIVMIKPRRMRWAGHAARMFKEDCISIFVAKEEEEKGDH
jgi:hypothetical protein